MPSVSRLVVEQLEVDQTFDRIHRSDHDFDARAGTQMPARAAADPAVAIAVHLISVIAQARCVQQAINPDLEQLNKTTELHNRRNEPLENLPYSLAQVAALQKTRNITIRLVRPLLEPEVQRSEEHTS